jgi:hypothetical protein
MQIPIPPENSDPIIRRTKLILSNPFKFDRFRNEYEGWKSFIKNKIDVNGEIIKFDRNQFIFIAFCLEEKDL